MKKLKVKPIEEKCIHDKLLSNNLYFLDDDNGNEISYELDSIEPLYQCSACVHIFANPDTKDIDMRKVYVLQSYGTIVAVATETYDVNNSTRPFLSVVALGRYSRTTYTHVSKFKKFCIEISNFVLCPYDTEEYNIEAENWFN